METLKKGRIEMNEPEVKKLTCKWLERQNYKVQKEIGVPNSNGEVILDFYGYRETNGVPEIVWCECKGDVILSKLLEGFIRLEFGVHYGGGTGILAVPSRAKNNLEPFHNFLKQAENTIRILNVETECV